MKVYRLSPAAEADLDDIWAYTATNWSTEQAEIYISRLFETFVLLGNNHGPANGPIGSSPATAVSDAVTT